MCVFGVYLTGASIRSVGGQVPVQRFTCVTGGALHITTALTLTLTRPHKTIYEPIKQWNHRNTLSFTTINKVFTTLI